MADEIFLLFGFFGPWIIHPSNFTSKGAYLWPSKKMDKKMHMKAQHLRMVVGVCTWNNLSMAIKTITFTVGGKQVKRNNQGRATYVILPARVSLSIRSWW